MLNTVLIISALRQFLFKGNDMKGYYKDHCYMGWIPKFHKYLPFATETEYIEFYKEMEGDK